MKPWKPLLALGGIVAGAIVANQTQQPNNPPTEPYPDDLRFEPPSPLVPVEPIKPSPLTVEEFQIQFGTGNRFENFTHTELYTIRSALIQHRELSRNPGKITPLMHEIEAAWCQSLLTRNGASNHA